MSNKIYYLPLDRSQVQKMLQSLPHEQRNTKLERLEGLPKPECPICTAAKNQQPRIKTAGSPRRGP
jgi:hypothetical protein